MSRQGPRRSASMAATLPGRMSAYSESIRGVVGVVDVGGELVRGPVVEEAGEDEAAVLAAAVVDVDAGEAEGEAGWSGEQYL